MDLALEADVADSGAVAAALAGAEARLGPLRYAVTAAGYYDRVVLLASEWGVTGWPNATAYAASKGGLVSLVKSAARALAADGVAVNAIAPGVTDTLLLEVDAADAGVSRAEIAARYGRDVPLGRVGRPEEIAAVAAFLCSEGAMPSWGRSCGPTGALPAPGPDGRPQAARGAGAGTAGAGDATARRGRSAWTRGPMASA